MNEVVTFIIFVIFLLVQYCIWLVSNYIGELSNTTGRLYWAIVVVVFLVLNEYVFGGFANETILQDDSRDEEKIWEWHED